MRSLADGGIDPDDEIVSVFVSGELSMFRSELDGLPVAQAVQDILGSSGFEVEDAWIA